MTIYSNVNIMVISEQRIKDEIMTTKELLTSEILEHWQGWYKNELLPKMQKFNEVQTVGLYTVLMTESKRLDFDEIWCYSTRNYSVDKVTKLKIGSEHRKTIFGLVIPSEAVDKFKECQAISEANRKLREQSINIASQLDVNGFARIKALSPEKLQQFIDLFS